MAGGRRTTLLVTAALVAVLVVALAAATLVGVLGHHRRDRGPTGAQATAQAAAAAFLRGYVEADGRVVRRDQGGDTVSEGQGYALLLAVATGDRSTFDRVWDWTRTHLQRPDGQLAYLWHDGHVADSTPAADADSQTAWALALAGRRFASAADTASARRLAQAVAADDTGYDDAGRPLLAAGPWATGGRGRSVTAEPGYWAAPALDALARLTGDGRLSAAQDTHDALLADLTGNGSRLPADWVTVGGGHGPQPEPAPGGGAGVRTAGDAQRALVWAALDPRPGARRLARAWWTLEQPHAADAPIAQNLDGSVQDADRSPLSAVAAAATAAAAGRTDDRDRLLAVADRVAGTYPTYYGSAWDALGRVLLTTDLLA